MTPECTFTLRNGQKCRGAALHHQEFCRHHASSSAYAPPRIAKRDIFTPLAQWRAFGRDLHLLGPSEIPFSIYQILDSLTSQHPSTHHSDLVAGRYLRILLSRLGHVPFARPTFDARAPQPRPVQAPAALSPNIQAALDAVHDRTDPESIDALIASLGKYGVGSPAPLP